MGSISSNSKENYSRIKESKEESSYMTMNYKLKIQPKIKMKKIYQQQVKVKHILKIMN